MIEFKETVGSEPEFGAGDRRQQRPSAGGDHDVLGLQRFTVDAHRVRTRELGMAAHEGDFFVGEIALVDAVQTRDVGIASFAQHRPVVPAQRDVETVMLCIVGRVRDLRRVPHHLFRYAADVDAGAAEARRFDQSDPCAVLGGALRAGEPATAATDHEQIEITACHSHLGAPNTRELLHDVRRHGASCSTLAAP